MLHTVKGIVREGTIELLEPLDLLEGSDVLVTLMSEEDKMFWLRTGQVALDSIWDNSEDDAYAELRR